MKQQSSTLISKLTIIFVLAIACVVPTFAQADAYLDPKNWTAAVGLPGGRGMGDNPQGITVEKDGLRFQGFHLGKEAQYALSPELTKASENKMVTLTVTFDGEFPGADSSFLAFAQRASSPKTIFWSQQCYALLFKRGQIEVQKHGKGNNPNIIIPYSNIAALGFSTFPIGKPVTISYGIIKEGAFPKMIVKINGKEVCNITDNKYGQTVKTMPGNVFLIGAIATNKENSGDSSSRSSVKLSSFKIE